MYEPGRYRVKTRSAVLTGSRKSNSPQIAITFAVLGFYDHDRQLVEIENAPDRTLYLPLSEATVGTPGNHGWVTDTLIDLGFVGPSFRDLDPLAGQERDATLRIEQYEGKDQERWKIWPQSGGGTITELDATSVRSLNSQHSALLRSLSKTSPATRPPVPPPGNHQPRTPIATNGAPPPAADDDIPF
jgi:hypothetical protein